MHWNTDCLITISITFVSRFKVLGHFIWLWNLTYLLINFGVFSKVAFGLHLEYPELIRFYLVLIHTPVSIIYWISLFSFYNFMCDLVIYFGYYMIIIYHNSYFDLALLTFYNHQIIFNHLIPGTVIWQSLRNRSHFRPLATGKVIKIITRV